MPNNKINGRAASYVLKAVISKDGNKIGYRQYGNGPKLILVQGAMGTAHNYDQLARVLSSNFTVFVPDRRGRGMSPLAYTSNHSIESELEDLDSLLTETGAHYVFGLSSGAIITLEASRVLPSIHKAILYEPPFYLEGGFPVDFMARYHREIDKGNLAAALITLGKIVRLGPALLSVVPSPILILLAAHALRMEERNGTGDYTTLRELVLAAQFDLKVVSGMDGKVESFKDIKAEILLLGGTKSPAYLKNALNALQNILPKVWRNELKGLDHSAAWNSDKGGAPEIVAQSIRHFLLGSS